MHWAQNWNEKILCRKMVMKTAFMAANKIVNKKESKAFAIGSNRKGNVKMSIPVFEKFSDIKVGVIGYGANCEMGKKHLTSIASLEMKPEAVVDSDTERLKIARDDFPCIEIYTTVDDMLANSSVNLVIIITPHNTHKTLALQCLKAGKHVICEKPFAILTEECDEVIAEAKKRNLLVTTYHNRHWDGIIVEAVRRIKKENAIGEIVRLEGHAGRRVEKLNNTWRESKSISGGITYDWGVHLIEWSLQLVDADVKEVSGYSHKGYLAAESKWKDDSCEDDCTVLVRFDNDVWLNLSVTRIDSYPKMPKRGFIEITGTEGTYIMGPYVNKIVRIKDGEEVVESIKVPSNQWDKFYENILDYLITGAPLTITPEWARRTIHILDLANKSAARGVAMKTKYN